MKVATLISLIVIITICSCNKKEGSDATQQAQILHTNNTPEPTPIYNYADSGQASYYANLLHGRPTASGAAYDKNKLTAAHRTLPFGTCVKVTNLRNNLSVEVEINDRGPFHAKRIIDLSRQAAKTLNFYQRGTARVKLEAYVEEFEERNEGLIE